MNTTVLEALSTDRDSEGALGTGGLRTEDWVLPGKEAKSGDASNAGRTDELDDTTSGEVAKFSAPVRRDNLVLPRPEPRLKLLQQWECTVLSVHDDYVECEMCDLTDEANPREYAEIYLKEFYAYDRPLLEEGATFYWNIGHELGSRGQVRRYSELRVRRMPRLSKLRQREISKKAERLSELLFKSGEQAAPRPK